MTDRPANEARQSRASIKEAIGKLMGDDATAAKGGAEKAAATAANHNGAAGVARQENSNGQP